MFHRPCIIQGHNTKMTNKMHFNVYDAHTFLTNMFQRVELLQEYTGTVWLVVSSIHNKQKIITADKIIIVGYCRVVIKHQHIY
jgi:hypothetical protein